MSNNVLKGKRGIIFGALDENSIAWKTAMKVKEEGATFTLTNAPIAMRMGKINEDMLMDTGSAKSNYQQALAIDAGYLPSIRALKGIQEQEKEEQRLEQLELSAL